MANAINSDGGGLGFPHLVMELLPVFREGISLVLSRWAALAMAIENEWGGRESRQKADQIASNIFSWFTVTKEPLYIDDLEDLLDQGMLTLNTEIDDGSIGEVAEKLMIMHEECSKGDYSSIERLREENLRGVARPNFKKVVNDDDEDEDDDSMGGDDDSSNMMVDAPALQSNLNSTNKAVNVSGPEKVTETEDGWTVVPPRRHKGRKN